MNDIVHGRGYSLLQKVMYARHTGEEKITLYLEDAERILEDRRELDKMIVHLMNHVPSNVLSDINTEIFDEN